MTFFSRLSSYAANALRYWEPRRLVYNGCLGVVVLARFLMTLPESRAGLTFEHLLGLFILAVLANVAYCAVYIADLFVQFAGLDAELRWGRPALLTVGTAFAATIAYFVVQGILP